MFIRIPKGNHRKSPLSGHCLSGFPKGRGTTYFLREMSSFRYVLGGKHDLPTHISTTFVGTVQPCKVPFPDGNTIHSKGTTRIGCLLKKEPQQMDFGSFLASLHHHKSGGVPPQRKTKASKPTLSLETHTHTSTETNAEKNPANPRIHPRMRLRIRKMRPRTARERRPKPAQPRASLNIHL